MKRVFLVFTLVFLVVFIIGCDKKPTTIATTESPTVVTTESPTTQAPTTVVPTTVVPTTAVVAYSIMWEVNGIIQEEDLNIPEGDLPVFNGLTPTKPSTDQYDYTFSGWIPAISSVQSDQTYVAQFTETIKQYTVQFDSNGGSAVAQTTVDYGTMLSEPGNPTNEGYHFMGWFEDSDLTQPVAWPLEITQNLTLYAQWNLLVPYGDYLSGLLNSYSFSPYSYIPESMMPEYNLSSQPVLDGIDYSTYMSISEIPFGGHGEQWEMVIANIEQSIYFFNVLSVVDTLATLSVSSFNNYIDSNPEDTAHYNFLSGIYSVTISFENNVIYYVLDYTATFPVIGEQTVQIALSQNILSGDKEGRIQIGEANALRYVATENSYEFAIKYGGIRRAYFEITRNYDGSVEGRIFEYLGLDETFTTGSAAQFFINEDYVSVVGNKSSSMTGWAGTINELYSVSSGKLLGYEVREAISSITYNTLWFNLDDTSGITSVKFLEAPLEDSNPYLVYINDSEELFVSKNVGGISLKTLSRRYDIELRLQYFYYEVEGEINQVPMLVPMIFVQEEQLSTLVSDVNSMNTGITFTFDLSTLVQNKIMDDYDTLIDDFIVQKDDFTTQIIIDFIGSAFIHE